MECPHLLGEECVKINRDFVRKQKIEISAATSTSKTWRCLGKREQEKMPYVQSYTPILTPNLNIIAPLRAPITGNLT